MNRAFGFVLLAGLLALHSTGCGETLNLTPASGKVTYQGKPVEGASVVFVPEKGPPGTGVTDATGTYTISTNGKPGATPGKNQVTVAKTTTTGAAMPANPTPEDMMKMASSGTMPVSKSEIPTKYAVVQGGLKAEVTADKKVFDFELTD